MGIRIQTKHLRPSSLVRNLYYVVAGLKLCRKYNGKFFDYYPSCANSLCTVWNISCLPIASPHTIVDVGAHDSEFARLLLLINPAARLISFEPQSECHPLGKVYRMALSDVNGEGTLCAPQGDRYGARLRNDPTPGHDSSQTREWRVEMRRFDSLDIDMTTLKKPVLLKVDVEGHELRVLKGFGQQLDHVTHVIIEVQNDQNRDRDYDALELYSYLATHGFGHSLCLNAWFDGSNPPAYSDVLFSKQAIFTR